MERGGSYDSTWWGFVLIQCPYLGGSIEGKVRKLLGGPLHNFDAIWQKVSSFEKKVLTFLRIAIKEFLQTGATDLENLGFRQVGL